MAVEKQWNTIQQTPLNQILDTRSRPASVAPGTFRWKLNMGINSTGNLCRRGGHAALNLGSGSNWDHHRRTSAREPISFLYENTSPAGVRQLFDGTESAVSLLDNNTGEWSDIFTGMGGGSWFAAGLRHKVVLTNNVDPVKIYDIATNTGGDLTGLQNLSEANGGPITKAKVALQFAGVVVIMNVEAEVDGEVTRLSNRILWSDYRDAEQWDPSVQDSVAGHQDLDEGEVILNAIEFAGVIYVFTDRAIWKMYAVSTGDIPFGFNRWYSDPKNRIGCLAYDHALVSTGRELLWLGRETIYWCNQFASAPTSSDWLLRASGTLFEGDDRIDDQFCHAPKASARSFSESSSREVWFSYPRKSTATGINDYSIVLSFNLDSVTAPYQTADYVDHGYTAFCSFAMKSELGSECHFDSTLVGASGSDWCLKAVGETHGREMVNLIGDDPEQNIPDNVYGTTVYGYVSIVRGMCPFGSPHRDKSLRNLLLDHSTIDALAYVKLRIGNSYTVQDANEDAQKCRVLWHDIDTLSLSCPASHTVEQMAANNERSDEGTEWPMGEQGRFLYYELTVGDPLGAPVVGGNTAWAGFAWEVMTLLA